MIARTYLSLTVAFAALAAEPTLLTLEQAEAIALEHDHRVQQAEFAFRRDQYGNEVAIGQLLPSLSATGAWRRSDPNGRVGYTDRYNSEIRLSQLIFSLPVFHSVRAAHWDKEAAFWNYMNERQSVLFSVREAHNLVIVARKVVAIQQRRLDLLKEGYENEAIKMHYGESTAFDYNRNKLEYTNALETYYGAVSQVEQAKNGWLRILGLDPENIELYDVSEQDISPGEVDLIATLLKRVPDTYKQIEAHLIHDDELHSLEKLAQSTHPKIQASSARARSASRSVEEVKGRYLPTLSGFTSYTSLSETESLVTSKISYWEGGVEANWVIFDGLQRESEIKRRRMQRMIAETALEEDTYAITLGVRDVSHQLQEAMHSYISAKQSEQIAEKSLELAKEGLELGSVTAIEYRDMIESLARAETSLARAQFQLRTRYYALIRAVGLEEAKQEELIPKIDSIYDRPSF